MAYIISSGITSDGISLANDSMTVLDGGIANETTVSSDGTLYISSGGTANSTIVSSGCINVSSGGMAKNTSIENWGDMSVFSGGMADYTTVDGVLWVAKGGFVNNTTLICQCNFHLHGTAADTIVESGGLFFVSSGGEANGITVNYGGLLDIYSGGTATMIRENGGYVYEADGTKATYLSNSFSSMTLEYQDASVHSGTTAVNITANFYGRLVVFSGGTAVNTMLNFMGALLVDDGGAAKNAIVSKGGYLILLQCGKITGKMMFENGAEVSAFEGGILDFDLTSAMPGGSAYVNNLSLVQGTPTYTITVDGTQENGNYILAEGASGFNSTITVVNRRGEHLGNLNIGTTLTVSFVDYTLSLNESALVLSVREEEPVISCGIVVSGGTRIVSSGELYQETFVDSGGILEIASGGRTKYTQIGSSSYDYYYDYYDQPTLGEEIVSSGGYAQNTIAINGTQTVYGLASGTVLSGMEYWDYYYYYGPTYVMGYQNIESGGTAIATRISSGAQGVGSSGVAIDTEMFYGSQVIVSGGVARNTWMNGGNQYVMNGGVASGNVIRGGWHDVSAGGSVYQETISSGYQYFSGYGDDIDIICGYILIAPTASVQNIQLHSGASMYVSGGSVTNLVQESGGRVIIDFRGNGFIQGSNQYNTISLNSRIASGFVYYAGAIQNVESGGTMLDPVLFSGAIMNVRSTGMVSGGIVAANGYMYVSKGASISNTTINSDGCVIVAEGSATGIIVLKGGNVVADFNAHIAGTSDGSAFSIQATNTTEDFIVLSGYTQIVDQGKTALWTNVNSGGCQVASSGGTATGTEISYGGSQFVSSGATANGAVVRGGYQYINSGTIVSDTVIYSGVQVVYRGATACNTIVSGGRQGLSYGASAIGTVLINGNQSISSGAIAENTIIRENGLQWLGDDYGYSYYDSTYPASAKNTHVSQGGTQRILYLGLAEGTVISSGGTLVLSCGSAVNVQHLSGGVLSIDLSETYFYDDMMGYEFFSSYAFASGTNVKGNFSVVSGTATNLILYQNASLNVGYGMSAIGTTISSGGLLSVQNGGVVLSADIEAGGQFFCSSGGSFISGHVASGGLLMVSGTHVSGVTLDKGAEVRLDFGGEITCTSDGQSFYSSCSNVISNFEIESGYTQTVLNGYRAEKSHIHVNFAK